MDRFWRLIVLVVGGFMFGWEWYALMSDIKGLHRDYAGLEGKLRRRLWGIFGGFFLMLAILMITGCASTPPSSAAIDWRTNYRLVRIVYVGTRLDFATQHLCPVGDAVYTVFEDPVDHTRLWRCSPPRGHVGDMVSLYE